MKTISISYYSAWVGRRLATALFVFGLQLSLISLPIGSLRAGNENEHRNAFRWKNLQSDIAGVADRTDRNLVNPWGLALNTNVNFFWVADNGTGVSTIYQPNGAPVNLVVTLPTTVANNGNPAKPTGIVFNFFPAFVLPDGNPATFIFDGEDGGISAWNSGSGAVLKIDNSQSGAIYKGLALGLRRNGGPTLYATNFHNGTVDVFDSSFTQVHTFPPTAFKDPALPPNGNFAPFGIASIDGKIYVTFAVQDADKEDDVAGPGNGAVDVFDADDGHLLQRLILNGPSSALNAPWGLAEEPHKFGKFGHGFFDAFFRDVLFVGNFGDGKINAFDIHTGAFLGPLKNRRGEPLAFDGLWALFFFDNRLYFTAGIADESHGLFGFIRPAEEREDHDSHD
jgi:uncharacterized protein (TIGR03118 family)